ncbi:DUF7010 family protein [Paenibacillus arenilitoris]|uniref:Uncharacterized protein n=1 Tax=Paenibacillus arenilitoris TaxID=2772299 RepID=A0A927CHF8_9BACL|nr:hypothetical protein [Paenibacillus arenilitoris]MBD2867579.1 hypothetical protein [Paenibacillus arenilitoris]
MTQPTGQVPGAALIIGGVGLVRASRALPDAAATSDPRLGKSTRLRFNLIFAAEGAAIAVAIAVCDAIDRTDLIPIIIALIVGIHFFPLAPLFNVRMYHLTGALLCVVAIATWLVFPEKVTVSGHEIIAYMSIVGLDSALILWATGLYIWLMGRSLLRA